MLQRTTAMFLVTLTLSVVAHAATEVNIPVPNGDFSNPTVLPGNFSTPADSWSTTTTTNNFFIHQNQEFLFGNDPNGTVFQNDIGTNLGALSKLTLSYDLAAPNQNTPTTATVELLLDGASVASSGAAVVTSFSLATGSFMYTPSAGDLGKAIGVRFTFSSPGNAQVLLDNVTLTQQVPAPAALPAGLAMLALAAMRRRR